MTPEQLQSVRADRWRQNSNPVLTLEDAVTWVGSSGLRLFLPRRNQFLTPAPSFVEASFGAPSDTPGPSAIANARGLMIRLVESGAALPLNLFGALSEQPDFLASKEAFPYIFSLRGGRNWKTPPPKATPLVVRIWKLLVDGASLEASEIQAALGHEITEAAVLRSLMDLWGGLRVTPLYAEDGPTRWELTQTRFEDALNAANRTAQTTGLSALVSLYLESVIAATPEEIEIFLSPLTARSKVRDVVNGLSATRQLGIVPVGTQTMYHIAGSLPEFAEPEAETSQAEPVAAPERARPLFERPRPERPRPERRPSYGRERTGDRPRTGPPQRAGFAARGGERQGRKPFGVGRGDRPPIRKFAERGPRTNYPRREEGEGGERRPLGNRPFERARGDQAEGGERPKFRSDRGKFPPKKFGTGGGKFPPKKFGPGGGKFPAKKFGKPKFGEGKGPARPWKREEGASSGERPFRPRREGSFDRPSKPRSYGAGEKRPFFRDKPNRQGGKFEERSKSSEGRPSRARRKGSFDRPAGPRSYGAGERRPFFRDKPNRQDGKFEGRSGSAEKSGAPRRDWKSKPGGFSKSGKPGFGKPKFGAGRPGGSAGASKFGGKKFGGPPSRGKSAGARPGFKSGPKPSFRKRKDQGDKGNKSSE